VARSRTRRNSIGPVKGETSFRLDSAASWNGWSPHVTNTRFQDASGLAASDVPKLKVK
jgi:hypothetical protein